MLRKSVGTQVCCKTNLTGGESFALGMHDVCTVQPRVLSRAVKGIFPAEGHCDSWHPGFVDFTFIVVVFVIFVQLQSCVQHL